MGNIGDDFDTVVPAVGTRGTTYATNINLFLSEVQTRLQTLVPRASLAPGDINMEGYNVENVDTITFTENVVAPPAGSLSLQGGDLYFTNTGGDVQITDGTTLNTSLVGGITGDYGGVNPAQFRFVDADQEYYAYDDYAGGAWARVWARNFDIAAGATSAFRARLAFGGGASVTYTLPAAAPASTQLLQMANTGAITATNDPTVTTLVASGNITASDFLHQGRVKMIPGSTAIDVGGSHTRKLVASGAPIGWTLAASVNKIIYPIPLEAGDKITGYYLNVTKNTSSGTISSRLYRYTESAEETQSAGDSDNTNAPGAIQLSEGSLTVIANNDGDNEQYYLVVTPTGGVTPTADFVTSLFVTYQRA